MNTAFKHYGKQPQTLIAKEALIAQAKYNLSDAQMAGLLQIHDFFQRVIVFNVPVYKLRIVEHRGAEQKHLPQGTRDFFSKVSKCSDLRKYLCSHDAPLHFAKFADKVMSNITSLADYIDFGVIYVVPERVAVPTVYVFKG